MSSRHFNVLTTSFLTLFIFGLLYPFKFGYHDVVIKRVGDALHLPLFLILTIVIWKICVVKLRWSGVAAVLLAAGVSVALAYLTEYVQPLTGRSESWADLRNGMLGVLVFAVWHSLIVRRTKRISTLLTGGLFAALFYYALIPALAAYELRQYQQASFPILVDFAHTPILNLWEASDSSEPAAQALLMRTRRNQAEESYLQVTTVPGKYSGVEFDAYGFSWLGFKEINFEMTNPTTEPLELRIRIDDCGETDDFKDRFNGTLVLEPGLNQRSIALSDIAKSRAGTFELERVKRILIFVDPVEVPQSFNLRKIWLSR